MRRSALDRLTTGLIYLNFIVGVGAHCAPTPTIPTFEPADERYTAISLARFP
jgi:hypothetical protein